MPGYTKLSTILNRMNVDPIIEQIEEQYKVRNLDEAIREMRRDFQFPWSLRKTSLRVFKDVLVYPTASDHDELAFYDNDLQEWSAKPDTRYTSQEEFFMDPNGSLRNDAAEIWEGGDKFLGVRYDGEGMTSQVLNTMEDVTDITTSGDAGTAVKDIVIYTEGNASIRVPITSSSGTATIEIAVDSFSDSEYQKKYPFFQVLFDSVPTSVELRLGNDSSNYFYSSGITTQFSGAAVTADVWNQLAFDLSTATEQGSVDTTAFDYAAIVLTGAASGTYYFDTVHLRGWEMLDYWYYGNNLVRTSGASAPDQEYFLNSSETYSTDSEIIGDEEWVDVIMYKAMVTASGNKETPKIDLYRQKAAMAEQDLFKKYPSLVPSPTTSYYNFGVDFVGEYYGRLDS